MMLLLLFCFENAVDVMPRHHHTGSPSLQLDSVSLPLLQAVIMRNGSGLTACFHLFCLPAWVLSLLWAEPGQGLWFFQKQFWSYSPSDSSCLIPGPAQSCAGAQGGVGGPAFLKAASSVGFSSAVGLRQRMWFYVTLSVAYRGGGWIGSKEQSWSVSSPCQIWQLPVLKMSRFNLLVWGLFHFGDGLVCQIRKLNWLILRLQDCQICHGRSVKAGNKTILLGSSPRFDHIMYNAKMSLVSLVTLNSFRDVQHLVPSFFLPYYFYYFKIKKQNLPMMKSLCI